MNVSNSRCDANDTRDFVVNGFACVSCEYKLSYPIASQDENWWKGQKTSKGNLKKENTITRKNCV